MESFGWSMAGDLTIMGAANVSFWSGNHWCRSVFRDGLVSGLILIYLRRTRGQGDPVMTG
jgi:hypothetical protein